MKVLFPFFVGLLGLCLTSGCAPSHAGRTVGQGVIQAEGNLGGPFITNLGRPIPVPNIPVGVRYGITDRIDISGHVNLLPIIMGGFLAFDASATWGLVKHSGTRGWNLATGTGFVFFSDFRDGARIAPLLDMAGGYTIEWFTPFVGAEMAIDFWGMNVVVNPYAGFEIDISNLTLGASVVWFYPGYNWYASTIKYVSPNEQGGIGILIGIKYRWDTKKKAKKEGDHD
jgi:hypothetical protein